MEYIWYTWCISVWITVFSGIYRVYTLMNAICICNIWHDIFIYLLICSFFIQQIPDSLCTNLGVSKFLPILWLFILNQIMHKTYMKFDRNTLAIPAWRPQTLEAGIRAWVSNYISQYSVGCDYLAMPQSTAPGTMYLIVWNKMPRVASSSYHICIM